MSLFPLLSLCLSDSHVLSFIPIRSFFQTLSLFHINFFYIHILSLSPAHRFTLFLSLHMQRERDEGGCLLLSSGLGFYRARDDTTPRRRRRDVDDQTRRSRRQRRRRRYSMAVLGGISPRSRTTPNTTTTTTTTMPPTRAVLARTHGTRLGSARPRYAPLPPSPYDNLQCFPLAHPRCPAAESHLRRPAITLLPPSRPVARY